MLETNHTWPARPWRRLPREAMTIPGRRSGKTRTKTSARMRPQGLRDQSLRGIPSSPSATPWPSVSVLGRLSNAARTAPRSRRARLQRPPRPQSGKPAEASSSAGLKRPCRPCPPSSSGQARTAASVARQCSSTRTDEAARSNRSIVARGSPFHSVLPLGRAAAPLSTIGGPKPADRRNSAGRPRGRIG